MAIAQGNALDGVVDRMQGYLKPYQALFRFQEQTQHLGHVIAGLTSDLERKSSEPIAVMFGLPRRVIQNFVGLSRWAWEPLRQLMRQEVRTEIGLEDGMLIIDESAIPKKGTETVGVARQWCGRLGKVDSCVVGVHAAYVGKDGQAALVDSQLFLPDAWAEDYDRREKVHVPVEVEAATKVQIAMDIVKRMDKELPFSQVTADEAYGRSTAFRDYLRALNKYYAVEVPCNTQVKAIHGTGSARFRRADGLCKLLKREKPLDLVLVAYGEKGPIHVHAMMLEVWTKRGKGRLHETLLYSTQCIDGPPENRQAGGGQRGARVVAAAASCMSRAAGVSPGKRHGFRLGGRAISSRRL
jgi:SRSO17 transposase